MRKKISRDMSVQILQPIKICLIIFEANEIGGDQKNQDLPKVDSCEEIQCKRLSGRYGNNHVYNLYSNSSITSVDSAHDWFDRKEYRMSTSRSKGLGG